ncbi:phosphatidylserine decarboxylase [Mariniphaga anaerophila]|uniref:Phosphatidylserine decarboxylase proenzyme n=1 Tax=Mariniphaga anaerophila TaxID=1484053 RepID=A0A1M5E1G2_9BACT|nr:phosphatidylserine decarboxylase family protein [Mariniphaga anaerophila]SHF73073.1 phosphatidylserine decarboxylase [Mariniphaga anaerophila]
MQIHNEGKKIIPVAFFVLAVIDAIIYFTLRDYLIFYVLMAASLSLAVLVVFFFRVPQREIVRNKKHVLAAADGEIVEIIKVYEKEYFKDERLQVSIFMSVFNVHQNRAPIGGEVVYQHHKRGAYYPAFVKKSSELNERCSTVFKMDDGTEVLSRQIAGTVAQRIVTYKKPGHKIEQGDEYGFIRFGSRVDLFLPLDSEVQVKLHQKTVGGQTVVALLNHSK